MDKGRFLIETHLRTGRSIKELAAAHQVSESWLFKLLRRYRLEGPAGLEPRSRRPKTSPSRIADLYEDEIVRIRKELAESGFDAGAETIHFHMATPGRQVPSVSTIHRVLVAWGFVTPQPHKRPKSSWKRFVAEFPNECWQADVTHVEVAEGVVYEVLNVIDDHSRLCVASKLFVTTRSPDVVRTLHKAAATWGYPQRFLTDNGRIFTTPMGSGVGAMEIELLSLGIGTTHGKPYSLPRPRARSSASTRRSRSTWPSRNRPRPRHCSRVSSTASSSTTTPSDPTAASGGADPSRHLAPGRRRVRSGRASRRRAIGSAVTTRWTGADR